MAKTLYADGNSGRVMIYNNADDPSVYANPTETQLGDLHFHSDLSYLGGTQTIDTTITHPQRTRSSDTNKWGNTNYKVRRGTATYTLASNSFGAIRPFVGIYNGAQMLSGTIIQTAGQSVRAVSLYINASEIGLFEQWLTFDDTLGSAERRYKVFVFETLFTPDSNTSIYADPNSFEAGFGKLSTDYRYLRREDNFPDFYLTARRTADVSGGGLKVVMPDGTTTYDSGYSGSFNGFSSVGVKI